MASHLIERYENLGGVMAAHLAHMPKLHGIGIQTIVLLRAIHEVARRMALEDILDRPILSTCEKVLTYCRIALGREKTEQFHLLFLDTKNHLIACEKQQQGTVDHTPVYPREVVKRALELDASALIMVHNHPSGDPTPSKADIAITRQVKAAAAELDIDLHDHIVIGRAGHNSFRSLGLL